MLPIEAAGIEPMTQYTWENLFERAKEHVPYFLVAESVLSQEESKWYDGVSFRKMNQLNPNLLDPLTQRSVVKIQYYLLRCFEVVIEKDFPKKNLLFKEACLQAIKAPEGFLLTSYGTDGVNYFGAEEDEIRPLVKKCQLIMANTLNNLESLPWLISAATDLEDAKKSLVRKSLAFQLSSSSFSNHLSLFLS